MQFSLMFFSSDAHTGGNRYESLFECIEFADRNGFTGVWLPERHFHRFGGLFPNPATIASAVAARTSRIRIKAGSIVLPLHDPIRVAEEWSVVDNISQGRVDLGFAQGWNPNDFVLAPDSFANRLETTFAGIETIKVLWRGDKITRTNGVGKEWEVGIFPPPIQKHFDFSLTCTKAIERFEEAGRLGANVLTALLMQDRSELKQKIVAYRTARAATPAPDAGHVTLMLHTYIGQDADVAKNLVRPTLTKYIEDSVDLWRQRSIDLAKLSEKDRQRVLGLAFERYFRESSLCGSIDTLSPLIEDLKDSGVNEIACLIDFGLPHQEVLASLHRLRDLKDRHTHEVTPALKAYG